jgi:hypothetical protein
MVATLLSLHSQCTMASKKSKNVRHYRMVLTMLLCTGVESASAGEIGMPSHSLRSLRSALQKGESDERGGARRQSLRSLVRAAGPATHAQLAASERTSRELHSVVLDRPTAGRALVPLCWRLCARHLCAWSARTNLLHATNVGREGIAAMRHNRSRLAKWCAIRMMITAGIKWDPTQL